MTRRFLYSLLWLCKPSLAPRWAFAGAALPGFAFADIGGAPHPGPTPTPTPMPTPAPQPTESFTMPTEPIWLDDRAVLGKYYQSQGRLPTGVWTNDCGPTNLAMVLNYLAGDSTWTKDTVAPYLWRLGWPFPQSIRGATPPWSMSKAFNNLAEQENLPWTSRWLGGGTREHLIVNLQRGSPTTIILVWSNGGAHYVTVVGYDPDTDIFYLLDPDPDYEESGLPPEKCIGEMRWENLTEHWSRQVWWTRLLWLHNEMIVYSPAEA